MKNKTEWTQNGPRTYTPKRVYKESISMIEFLGLLIVFGGIAYAVFGDIIQALLESIQWLPYKIPAAFAGQRL